MRNWLSSLNQRLFGNVGGAIKKIARVLCWIGIVLSFIGGIVSGFTMTAVLRMRGASVGMTLLSILLALLIIVIFTFVGGFLSWLSSLMAYGFGEIVEMAVRDRNRSGGAARPQRSRAPAPRYARQVDDDDWDGYRG